MNLAGVTQCSTQQQFTLEWLNTRHVEYDTTIMLKNAAIPLDVRQAIWIRVSHLISILNFALPLEFIASRSLWWNFSRSSRAGPTPILFLGPLSKHQCTLSQEMERPSDLNYSGEALRGHWSPVPIPNTFKGHLGPSQIRKPGWVMICKRPGARQLESRFCGYAE